MAASNEMPTFRALSYGEKWHVTRLVAKGEAPRDVRMAGAVVELAERYQRRGRVDSSRLVRWGVIALIPAAVAFAIFAASKGDTALTITMAALALTNVAHLAFNPAMRPKNVARSLEASRRASAAGN